MTCSQDEKVREDKRVGPIKVFHEGRYNPGITRIEEIIRGDLSDHVEEIKGWDPETYQAHYNLLEHCARLSEIVAAMRRARNKSERNILLGRAAGLTHDVGKCEEECHLYLLNRSLTEEERLRVRKHPKFSADYVLSLKPKVRPVDHPFFDDLAVIVHHHHEPWKIPLARLREITWDVMAGDIFLAMMENRHRPGLSQFQAVEALPQVVKGEVRKKTKLPVYHEFHREIRDSISIIAGLYGVESIIA